MVVRYEITAGDFSHAGRASSEVKKLLKQLGIEPKTVKRVVVALFEAEVNAAAHSYGGSAVCSISPEGIDITVADEGPGIPDLDLAMTEGYSTAAEEIRELGYGAGMGLPNILNNTDELSIDTGENAGTTVHMRIWFSRKNKDGDAEPEQELKQEPGRENQA